VPKKFIVSDESINSYGFRILTKGIKLDTFKKNPVMLFNHMRSDDLKTEYNGPVGRWENLSKEEDNSMTADAIFDENDPKGAILSYKVENSFLNAASIGIKILKTSVDEADLLPGQIYPTVTACELVEISVCDIPSNKNAIALYDTEGKVLNLNDLNDIAKLSDVLAPIKKEQSLNPIAMKFKLLSAWTMLSAFFGASFGSNETEKEFEATPDKLQELNDKLAELENLKVSNTTLTTDLSTKDGEIATLKTDLATSKTANDKAAADLAAEKEAHEKLKETLGAQGTNTFKKGGDKTENTTSWVDPNASHNQLRNSLEA
jgi:Skp family chaperone for outer membrane proteins